MRNFVIAVTSNAVAELQSLPDPSRADCNGGADMLTQTTNLNPADPGLVVLVTLLRFNGVGADPEQIRHRFGGSPVGTAEMLRLGKELGLKARATKSAWPRLANTPLPAIAALKDGGFLFLAKAGEDKVLVQSPSSPRPSLMTRAEFETAWDGRLVLMTRRAGLLDLSRHFDITWFLGAIYKYRRLLGEVMVASFFLQIFALVSPLFFQVVIDKVLVHRGISTLDVLMMGLVTIGVFETILGILRTYLFAHTTNRIDVELGARLFRHLLALPIAYFQARRVGDSVARVRELENIRNFLTSSALLLDELNKAEAKAAGLVHDVAKAEQRARFQTLTAPVDGVVQQLAVHTVGGVVTPAQALLVLVPQESQLEIEAMVSNRDIGFVHPGQEAEIKVDTFTFTRYGLLHGKVLSVSQDAITKDKPQDKPNQQGAPGADNASSEPKGQEMSYAARVSLDRTQMQIDDNLVNLGLGMAVTVEIKTGERTVLSYLLSPIMRYKHDTLRER